MHEICFKIITFLHIMYILFIVISPFSNIKFFLVLHAITVPFMMLHWVTNNNICALTYMEKHIHKQVYGTEQDNNNCFTCKLIGPVYDFTNDKGSFNVLIYTITIGLWGVTIYSLYNKFKSNEIKTFYELFT